MATKLHAEPLVAFGPENVSNRHGKTVFLRDITFTVAPGTCLGVLGDNGSGKSSLMSILAGVSSHYEGQVLYNGKPIDKMGRQVVGYVPQRPVLLEELSVRDNLALWQSVYGLKGDVLAHVPEFLNLSELLPKKAKILSGGMRKKVAIAIALMHQPQVLILDEAFAALDAKTVEAMGQYLQESAQMAVIYSSHNIHEIAQLCTAVMVLQGGQVSYQAQGPICSDAEDIGLLYSKF